MKAAGFLWIGLVSSSRPFCHPKSWQLWVICICNTLISTMWNKKPFKTIYTHLLVIQALQCWAQHSKKSIHLTWGHSHKLEVKPCTLQLQPWFLQKECKYPHRSLVIGVGSLNDHKNQYHPEYGSRIMLEMWRKISKNKLTFERSLTLVTFNANSLQLWVPTSLAPTPSISSLVVAALKRLPNVLDHMAYNIKKNSLGSGFMRK